MASSLSNVSLSNMSRALSQSDREGDWLDRDPDYAPPSYSQQANDVEEYYSDPSLGGPQRDPTQSHDFWVPRVGADGRVSKQNPVSGIYRCWLRYDSLSRYSTLTHRPANVPMTCPRSLQMIQTRTLRLIPARPARDPEHTGLPKMLVLEYPRDLGHQNLGYDGWQTMGYPTTTSIALPVISHGHLRRRAYPAHQ